MAEDPGDTSEPKQAAAAAPGGNLDLARLSHELRTPLSAIAALSEMMRDERLGPLGSQRYRDYAGDIHESSRQALRILAAYVEAGASEGSVALDFVELDPGALVGGCVSALVPLAERSGVLLGAEIAGSLPRLICDRRVMRQIVDNLVANAIRFTPPGGTVTLGLNYLAGGALVLVVTDTGDGMSATEIERAQSGVAAPEPLRRRSSGTGIGLPLVHALATALRATLQIESRLREGTRVSITFPHERLVYA